MLNFPEQLGCWVVNSFKNTAPQAKRYLGAKTHEDRRGIINAKFVLHSKQDAEQLFEWWVLTANYGLSAFSVTLPYFEMPTVFQVTMTNDLTINLVKSTYEANFKFKLLVSNYAITLIPPEPIIDFSASENIVGKVKFTWTNTVGDPQYDLYVIGITYPIATNIISGHIINYDGSRLYYIKATNPLGFVDSNTSTGTGVVITTLSSEVAFDTTLTWVGGTPNVMYDIYEDDVLIASNVASPQYVSLDNGGYREYKLVAPNVIGNNESNSVITHITKANVQINYKATETHLAHWNVIGSSAKSVSLNIDGTYSLLINDAAVTQVNLVPNTTGAYDDITDIEFVSLDTTNPVSLSSLFNNCKNAEKIDMRGACVKGKAAVMDDMFSRCNKVKKIELDGLDTSATVRANGMFYACQELEELDISMLDWTLCGQVTRTFSGCSKLKDITLPVSLSGIASPTECFRDCISLETFEINTMITPNTTTLSGLFWGCSSLKTANLSGSISTNVTIMGNVFRDCTLLETVNFSGFTFLNTTNWYATFLSCDNLRCISFIDTRASTNSNKLFGGADSLVSPNAAEQAILADDAGGGGIFSAQCTQTTQATQQGRLI